MSAQPTTLAGHIKTTLLLATPLIGAQMAQMGIGVADTGMVSWLGTDELAAVVLATQMWFVTWLVIAGFGFAISPMVATAAGNDDQRGIRRAVRMGLWASTGWGLLGMLLLSQIRPILGLLQQEAHLIDIAAGYMSIAIWALIPTLWQSTLRSFVTSIEHTKITLVVVVCAMVVNVFLNWVLIFGNLGAPALGVNGSAWATLITNVLSMLAMIAYVTLNRETAPLKIFSRLWVSDPKVLREVNVLGAPIALTMLAETSLFWVSSIFMGWISVVALAAHGIVLQLASIAFMFPLCIGQISTVRVGRAYGTKDTGRRNLAAQAALIIAAVMALLLAAIFVLAPGMLISLFLDFDNEDAQAVLAAGIPLLIIGAFFQFGDSLQVVALGILRGAKDTGMPMKIAVFSYWVIAAPLAYILAFPLGFGGPGVWAGLGIGLSIAAVLMTWRIKTSFASPI